MPSGGSLGAAVGTGLGLWCIVSILGRRMFVAIVRQQCPQWSVYQGDLMLGRETQSRTQSVACRVLGKPVLEEGMFRGFPIAVGFAAPVNRQRMIGGEGLWALMTACWVLDHIWRRTGSHAGRLCKFERITYWSSSATAWLHAMDLGVQVIAYTAAWVGGLLTLDAMQSKPVVGWGFVCGATAAVVAHGLHNVLVFSNSKVGQLYRRMRGNAA